MPRITISYRRDDSGVITGRIYDRLVARYGRDTVFRDIGDNPIGVDFRVHIGKALSSSDAVLAIVGPHWAGPSASQSRLSNEADPVRIEIETALAEGVPIIPILVLGAAMPTTVELPESLREFAYRNAVQIDHGQDFDIGMGRLIRALDAIVGVSVDAASEDKSSGGAARTNSPKRFAVLGAAGFAVLTVALVIGWYAGTRQQVQVPPSSDTLARTVPLPPSPRPEKVMAVQPAPIPPTVPAPQPTSPPTLPTPEKRCNDLQEEFIRIIDVSNPRANSFKAGLVHLNEIQRQISTECSYLGKLMGGAILQTGSCLTKNDSGNAIADGRT